MDAVDHTCIKNGLTPSLALGKVSNYIFGTFFAFSIDKCNIIRYIILL